MENDSEVEQPIFSPLREDAEWTGRRREIFQTVIDGATDGFFLVDPETGELLDANGTACEMHGYERAELLDVDVWDITTAVGSRAEFEEKFGPDRTGQPTLETEHERADGSRFPVEAAYSTVEIDGQPYWIVIVRDVTERKEQAQRLVTAETRYRTLLEATPDPILIADLENGEIVDANEAATAVLGYERDELVGLHYLDLHPPDLEEQHRDLFEAAKAGGETARKLSDGSQNHLVAEDGDEIPVEVNVTPVELPDQHVVIGVFRVVEDQLEYEQTLAGLSTVGKTLCHCRDVVAAAEEFVETVTELFGFDCGAVYSYDEETGTLQPVVSGPSSRFANLVGEPPEFEPGDGIAWQVFVENESARRDDVPTEASAFGSETRLRSELLVPLGKYGVGFVGDTQPGAFDGRSVALVETLAYMVETAFERLERESEIEEQQRQLDRRREEIDRLEEVTAVFRKLTRATAKTKTRGEVERAVCQHLVDTDVLSFAWIGKREVNDAVVQPRGMAGNGDGYLQYLDLHLDTEGAIEPALEAVRTGQPVIVQNTRSDMFEESWREEAVRRGFQSVMSVPIVYQTSTRGVLTVYAETENAFDGLLQSILRSLADFLAHADVATDRTQALVADTTTELEFEIRDPKCFFLRFAEQTGATLTVEKIEPGTAENWTVHVAIDDCLRDECLTQAKEAPEVQQARCPDTSGRVCEMTVSEPFIVSDLASHGVVVRNITAEKGTCTVTVGVPSSMSTSTAADVVSTLYPESRLLAKRQHSVSADQTEKVRQQSTEQLTPRQREVLREAFRHGYFESPKGASGAEIAEQMGLSSSAFHNHLKAAERKLVGIALGIEDQHSASGIGN